MKTWDNKVYKLDPSGQLSTVAGTGNEGFSGDGGPAVLAELAEPMGIAVGQDDVLYIADYYNNRIRMVDADGIITTIAGSENPDNYENNIPATDATLEYPFAISVGPDN